MALERTRPNGRVIGIDLIPAQPPRGVATFQGDFLSPSVQAMVKKHIQESHLRHRPSVVDETTENEDEPADDAEINRPSYIDMERHTGSPTPTSPKSNSNQSTERLVDVCLYTFLVRAPNTNQIMLTCPPGRSK